jgi:4-amino-4-deoxy-L-arabinose transferase-like glycosyltransferase
MAASSWSKRDTLVTIIWTLILAGVTLLLNLRWSPVYQALEADSGVYAYVGSAILEGQLPYRDVWEHKPPVGFYLNALALAMFGHNPWAIWWFNVIWVAITTMVFFLLIRKMMGTLTGCLASLFFLTGVMVPELFQGGNLMEVYGLLPQVLLIAAVYQFFSKQKERWIFAAGLLTGIAFLTKQTTIALGLSSILAIFMVSLLRREFKHALLRPILFSGGVIAPIVLASSYWLMNGAVYDFLDAVFLHSLAYVGERASFLWSLKNTFLSIFPKLTISRLYYIAFGSFILYCFENFHWFVACLHRDRNSRPVDAHPVELTMLAIFITLPLEVAFASLGARNFGHYFLTLIPAGATVAAYIIWKTINGVNAIIGTKKISSLLSVGWFVLFTTLAWWLGSVVIQCAPNTNQLASINRIFGGYYEISEMEQYIINTTKPSDHVLVWHIHTGVNFITQRQAAAQVLFPMNLFIGNSKMPDFISQMTSNPPELIVFQKPSSIGMPFVDENIDEWCESGCMPEIATGLEQPPVRESLIKFQKFFQQHYILDMQIHDWYIYRHLR